MAAQTGVLHKGWLSGSQIAGRAIAEPAAIGLDVDPLRDRKLGTRVLNVAAERVGSAGGFARIRDAPPMPAQSFPVLFIAGVDAERDFELLGSALREGNELT